MIPVCGRLGKVLDKRRKENGRTKTGNHQGLVRGSYLGKRAGYHRQLVKLGQTELNWKRTTTYTVLKRLCEKGLFQNQEGTATSLISKPEFEAEQSRRFGGAGVHHPP